MQALAWFLERQGQLFKPDSGIDEIPEDGFAYGGVACEIGIERLRKKCFPKARVPFHTRRDRVSKFPCECHRLLRSVLRLLGGGSVAIVGPALSCRLDSLLLALFCAATQQDH